MLARVVRNTRFRSAASGLVDQSAGNPDFKAEVVTFDDLMAAGSLPAARAAGKARIEGRDYVMRDGDVVEFRFSPT